MQKKLILASQSPRRKRLLEEAGIALTIKTSGIDEGLAQNQAPDKMVQTLAQIKAKEVSCQDSNEWILGADTIVVIDDLVLGKPSCLDEAVSMLNRLNNRVHLVYTGFCLLHDQKNICHAQTVCTQVQFKPLTEKEIIWYAGTGKPMDKAGGYGIQGLGAFMVKKIMGSYTNVVGLPVCEVFETLVSFGVIQM